MDKLDKALKRDTGIVVEAAIWTVIKVYFKILFYVFVIFMLFPIALGFILHLMGL